ncbi:MAG: sulfite exporter TauE/SafE family protein [Thermotogae bacterium]|nr:sulfite exporter TauE/SafE family protein [Thermotogota bacterium]MCL5032569.1 sulfite exporter TauE/SafE family protein [Thermotogota bacterium]
MEILLYILTYAVGVLTGFMNVIGGGGSVLTLPLLTFLGLSVGAANGTNRVSILLQNIVSTYQFKKGKIHIFRTALPFAIIASIGAIAGTFVVVSINQDVLKKVIGVILIIMGLFIVFEPKVWESGSNIPKKLKWMSYVAIFAIGFYGGFLQAGVGFFFIAALTFLGGFDIVKTNAIKVLVIAAYTVFSLAIFVSKGMVNWPIGITLSLGSMTGAYFGTKFTLLKKVKWIRYVLFAAVVVSVINFFI